MPRIPLVALVLLACVLPACGREPARCDICRMEIPADTYTIVTYQGQRHRVCDPRCALTLQEQTRTPVRLDAVTDFPTRERLAPRDAFFVTGSDTAPDSHSAAVRTWHGTPAERHWHRCLPSVLAFREPDAARGFQREHGGTVMRLADLGFAARAAR